ncbi:MAG: DUF1566 domain-containing protein [Spirochaetales bacterium]|nr:DUF1566 domain-containing protein [Spirochaetales bacterium]
MIRTALLLLLVLCSLVAGLSTEALQSAEGQVLNGARFTDNGDGTVVDKTMGLTWIPRLKIEATSLKEAKALCSRLEYAGQKNWRLPTKGEFTEVIASLKSKEEQVLFSVITRAEPSALFWTSSLHVQDPEKQGGFILENRGPNPFVETVHPNGSVVIHGGAEGPGVYFIVVRDEKTSTEKKNLAPKQEQK